MRMNEMLKIEIDERRDNPTVGNISKINGKGERNADLLSRRAVIFFARY